MATLLLEENSQSVCAEVRISSADPDAVIQVEHLESLSQTASSCDVVS